MPAIQEGEHIFPVSIDEGEDEIDIFVGNANRRKSPCIHISIYSGRDVLLQDLVFFSHCSASNKAMVSGDGSLVVMLKAVLKWLVHKYAFITRIEFMDKSYYQTLKGRVMLPEKMMLTEGRTWYMKHFGAEPLSPEAVNVCKKYKAVFDEHRDEIRKLPTDAWYYENLEKIIQQYPSLNGKMISTTTWCISRKTIEKYNVAPKEVQAGGGDGKSLKRLYLKHKSYSFPLRIYVKT